MGFNINKISNNNNIKIQFNKANGIDNEHLKLWVFFNKKDNQVINNINKETFGISELSYERRLKRQQNKSSIFDELDLPVLQDHIDEILNCSVSNNIEIVHTSKWLNSVSIKIKNINNENQLDNLLDCFVSKSFVDSIDIVSKYRGPAKINKQNNKQHHKQNNKDNNNNNKKDNKDNNSELFRKLNKVKLQQKIDKQQQQDEDIPSNFYGGAIKAINQSQIYKLHQLGYSGHGVTILVCDTGFYKGHEAFKNLKLLDEYDFINKKKNTTDPLKANGNDEEDDQNAHGTATLSVLGSLVPGTLVGVAFSANYLLAKTEITSGEDTSIEEDNWVAAIEWGESKGACVVSSSLSYLLYDYPQLNGKVARISKMASLAISKGMVIVNSMGNNFGGIFGAPVDSDAISVGAVDEYGVKTDFSGYGPTADGRIKPEVMAFGKDVLVAFINYSNFYTYLSGTSFSCPLVAGIVALLMQAHPTWSSSQIKQALLKTSSNCSNPNQYTGYGLVNAYEAYKYIPMLDNCFISGCSNHGTCCFGKCLCSDSYYGTNCEYKKMECGSRCRDFNYKCQINSLGKSYNCLYNNDTQLIISKNTNQLPICKI